MHTAPEWLVEESWDEVFRRIVDQSNDLKKLLKQLLDLELELDRLYELEGFES